MSILGAYLDWQRRVGEAVTRVGFITAYVEINPDKTQLIEPTILNILAALPASSPAPPIPNAVRIDRYERQLLQRFATSVVDPAVDRRSVNAVFYIEQTLVFNATGLQDILPPSLQNIVRVVYLGTTLAPHSPGLLTPPHPPQIPDNIGEPVCAIIDEGIGFLNTRFTSNEVIHQVNTGNQTIDIKAPRTRFIACWLQNRQALSSPPPALFNFPVDAEEYINGLVLRETGINKLLGTSVNRFEPDKYRLVNHYVYPGTTHHSTALNFSHGTHVADLACGADPELDEDADMRRIKIIAVQMPPQSLQSAAGRHLEGDILQAVRWIFYQAIEYAAENQAQGVRPLVINISLGVTAGAKNGTGLLEYYLEQEAKFYQSLTGASVEIVMAFGNDQRSKQIAEASVKPNGVASIDWQIQPDDRKSSYLEIRPQAGEFAITVKPPGESGTVTATGLAVAARQDITDDAGNIIASVYRQPSEPGVLPGDPTPPPVFILAVCPTHRYNFNPPDASLVLAPAGRWQVLVKPVDTGWTGTVNFQVQRGDSPVGYRRYGRQSYLTDKFANHYDPKTGIYEAPGATSNLVRRSTHSSIAAAAFGSPPGTVWIYSVGATYLRKKLPAVGPNVYDPSLYTAQGSTGPVLVKPTEPTYSADGDDSRVMIGVLATGTLTGTVRRLAGTSAAAPQVVRWRLLNLLAIPVPAPDKVDPSLHNRLGQWHMSPFKTPNPLRGRRDARIYRSP